MSGHRLADACVLAAATLWGTGGLFIRFAALRPETIAFFRMAVPFVLISAWFLLRAHKISREGLGLRLTASFLNAIRMYFFFLAFEYTSVSIAIVTLYTWPIFATLFALPINREPISRTRFFYLMTAFGGVLVLYLAPGAGRLGGDDVLGISAMLFSAAIHALAVVLLKRAQPGGSNFETTFFQNLVGAIVFGGYFLLRGEPIAPAQLAWALSLGAVVGFFGFTLFFVGLHRVSTARASNLTYFEIPVAVATGTVLLGEPLGWSTVVGGAIISFAVIASRRVA